MVPRLWKKSAKREQKVSFTIDVISLLARLDTIEKRIRHNEKDLLNTNDKLYDLVHNLSDTNRRIDYIKKYGELYQEGP